MKLVLHYLALVFSASAAVARHFIIEFETSHNAHSFRRSLDSVSSSLKRSTVKHEITRTFAADGIFHGVAVKLNDVTDAKAIAKMSGVKSIRPSLLYNAPNPVHMHIIRDASIPVDTESTHTMIGADKVHANGNIGKGINIGIIDTGVDYTHPSLGGGFGEGFKVNGGYDFVGDAFDPDNEGAQPVPDSDPLDTCNGHGTIVAGIIGADPGNSFNISGVAPGASISAYRVFGCKGRTRDDVVIEALLRAVKDEQNIITLSLGQPSGWTESTVDILVDRIAASGIIVTAAVGNTGASGSWTAESPSTGIHAISVASVDNTVFPARNATVKGADHAPFQYVSLLPLNTTSALPIYATSKDTSVKDDACNALPDDTPDLSPFLVVIRRGNCSYVQKIENIAKKGAKFAFIYNNVDGPLSPSIAGSNFSVGGIEAAHGEFLVQQFAAKASIKLSFPQDNATNLDDPHGNFMSSFSSYGPTFNLYFKPALSAPGGNIISIFPVNLGSYTMASGTSMATPFVAASAALLLAAKGRTKLVGKGALSVLESTAQKLLSTTNDGDPLQTLTQQGAGLINIFAAIDTTTIITPTELLLNSTAHFDSVKTFTVKNSGKKAKSYTLGHVPAGTAITVQEKSIFAADGPVPLSSKYATAEITPLNFNLKPGKIQTVKVKFTEPKDLDPNTFPVYSGFIEVNSGSESQHVVYLGMVGDLKDKQVLDNTSDFAGFKFPAIATPDSKIQAQFTNYTFKGTDHPLVLFRMSFGSPLVKIDLVDASNSNITGGSFTDDMVVGSILSNTSIPRNNDDLSPDGLDINKINMETAVFDDGSTIPNGSYRFLIRALRVTGNPNLDEDYDYALTDSFGVQI